jgi:glycosyltransferase involved in cell wall biosynthesis
MGTADVLAGTRGSIVVAEEPVAFARAVGDVLGDRALRDRLSAAAPADAQRWSSRSMAERLLALYTRVCEARAAAGAAGLVAGGAQATEST